LMDALAAVIESDPSCGRLMYADAYLGREAVRPTMIGERPLDLHRAFDGALGLREAGEHAIPTVTDLLPSMPPDQAAERLVVPSQHFIPRFITHGLDQRRRLHDVGEQEGAGRRIARYQWRRLFARVGKHLADATLVYYGREPGKGRMGRPQFEDGTLGVAARLVGGTERGACQGLLVGGADFPPQCQRLTEISHGTLRLPFRQRDSGARVVRVCLQGRDRMGCADRPELCGSGRGRRSE